MELRANKFYESIDSNNRLSLLYSSITSTKIEKKTMNEFVVYVNVHVLRGLFV